MARHSKGKVKLATLLIVGEGPEDEAFLKYMKDLYDRRDSGQRVTITAAAGGSPGDVIDTAIRKHRNAEFDRRYVLLDSDRLTKNDRALARQKRIELIVSGPHCLEGMLLGVLGQTVPNSNQACKAALKPFQHGHPTDPKAYKKHFHRELLDNTDKEQIVILRHAISNTELPK